MANEGLYRCYPNGISLARLPRYIGLASNFPIFFFRDTKKEKPKMPPGRRPGRLGQECSRGRPQWEGITGLMGNLEEK